ncbi:PepSY-like domain-containing protein [Pseudochryseolinea flava]|uniref:Putative beta-lactamase-inhibitor-like PepSY-like domain-containing protein n=1 Tax=Pseudochryseolinea flava TaxID=2059302 RepID=A0A364Y2F3_9BACT|nr:PepSY-like domain-containing protein [Pseudochryseolinea flava]RAW00936.1 hypothetical protein DQQ10_11900 [Pseudochryseolinea flava]
MKMLSLSVALLSCCAIAHAQKINEADVPKNVRIAFSKSYPYEKNVVWEKDNGLYEASFGRNRAQSVVLRYDGSIEEVATNIDQHELPKAVRDVLSKGYTGYTVVEANKIQTNGNTSYEAAVSKGQASYDLIFDSTGKLLKKVDKRAHHNDDY